jgi:hypothetical protein
MGAAILGLVYLVTGIVLWVSKISLTLAFVIFLVSTGIALILFLFRPSIYARRV